MIDSEILPEDAVETWAGTFAQVVRRCHANGIKLVLLTGADSEKLALVAAALEVTSGVCVNLGLALSSHLQNFSPRQYALETADYVRTLHSDSNLILNHLEILFDPGFDMLPLVVLKAAARRRLVVANWPGRYDLERHALTFAVEGDIAYREYPLDAEMTVVDASGFIVN